MRGGDGMTRVALVETDPMYRRQFREYLDRFSGETGERFRVKAFEDGDEIIQNYQAEYDVILMDFQLKFVDGMTAAQEIRRQDSQVVIIFLSALDACAAVKGYQVGALDFLLKPTDYEVFSRAMGRALDRLWRRRHRYIYVANRNGVLRLDCARIRYIEVDGRDLIYHTEDGDFTGPGTLREVEDSLTEGSFFRCGKGCLVNLEHVDGLENGDALVHGATVQVSRSKRKAFLDAFNRCVNEVRA